MNKRLIAFLALFTTAINLSFIQANATIKSGSACFELGQSRVISGKTYTCVGKLTWKESRVQSKLEIFSWWASGGEAEGFKRMADFFAFSNPKVEFLNAANIGPTKFKSKSILLSRLAAGNPPDTFQTHAGAELSSYVKDGQLEDLSFLYKQQGWNKVFPADLIKTITSEKKIYSVPVNIHRTNVLWWNPATAAKAGITSPPKTIKEFIVNLEKFKSIGVDGIALAGQGDWAIAHLFDSVLLATLGATKYEGLFNGRTSWLGIEVVNAIENLQRILSFGNSSKSLGWPEAGRLLTSGKAGYFIMGDWTTSQWQSEGLVLGKDLDWAPSPGTTGIFQWMSDSFTLPKRAKNREAGIAWLKVCGSLIGQDVFSLEKGSIPVRTDIDSTNYDSYQKSSMVDWKTNKLVGSIVHGVNYDNAGMAAFNAAVGQYYKEGAINNAQFAEALNSAYRSNGR